MFDITDIKDDLASGINKNIMERIVDHPGCKKKHVKVPEVPWSFQETVWSNYKKWLNHVNQGEDEWNLTI